MFKPRKLGNGSEGLQMALLNLFVLHVFLNEVHCKYLNGNEGMGGNGGGLEVLALKL